MTSPVFKSKVTIAPKAKTTREHVWEKFRNDHAMLKAHRVTPDEIEALKTVVLFGSFSGVQDILFVLRQMRGRRR